ncbi:MAG: hypothetical protein QOD72_7 [Acidimicrobiaceae bacterium]|nr:hypothetical protein [Acidimicrobiaceae bacterium]
MAVASQSGSLRRVTSARLVAAGAVAAGGFTSSIVFGRAEYAAAAAPFAVLVMVGILGAKRPQILVRIRPTADRVIEGDLVELTVELEAEPSSVVDAALSVHGPVDASRSLAWSCRSRRTGELEWRLPTTSWGRVVVGPAFVRAWGPLSLVSWEGTIGESATVAVVPNAATLKSLVVAHEPRATAGVHPARVRGDGWTFAELRPYQPGDRLRQINVRATARLGVPWVNERHLDRSADLVVLVDALAETAAGESATLVPIVRAAWSIADAHLRTNDRVGLIVFGGTIGWIAARSGLRSRAALFERLLAVEPGWTAAQRSVAHLSAAALPPGAQVIVLTPLHDERVVTAAAELRRRGFAVAALILRPALAVADSALDRSAARLWELEIDRRTAVLQRAGIPIVSWHDGDGVDGALDALRRRQRRGGVRS